ncbi:hypothetical protein LE181_08145 [Streptomyces sp. SCA3-4]|uniref:hypothetical protein n=1 Tax=Streptomyces sichuanensis TaxID=2871810 RepID=UPI001CE3A6BB|nr:hypothetical protein [Streptomyces sichuanensis]MCA6092130.1 hypothetical protein [Streptomyces sichuanensis]
MRDEWYYRRGHWVRKPAARRNSGPWTALAVAAVLGWGMFNGCLHDGTDDQPPPTPPFSSPAVPR